MSHGGKLQIGANERHSKPLKIDLVDLSLAIALQREGNGLGEASSCVHAVSDLVYRQGSRDLTAIKDGVHQDLFSILTNKNLGGTKYAILRKIKIFFYYTAFGEK